MINDKLYKRNPCRSRPLSFFFNKNSTVVILQIKSALAQWLGFVPVSNIGVLSSKLQKCSNASAEQNKSWCSLSYFLNAVAFLDIRILFLSDRESITPI